MAFTLIDLAGGTGGASEININIELQSKTVDSSTNSQLVKPTDGYIGIKDVTVNPYVLDSSSATITENGDYVFTSAEDGLSRVDVSVNIPDPALDEKTVDSSTVLQEVTSDAYGLRKVTVNPYVLSPLEVNSSTASQEFTGQYGTVTVNPYTLDSKTVDSSTNSQTITSDEDGLSSVTVNPYVLDSSTVDPSTNQIVVTSSEDGLSSVTVNGVTSSIDSNILASNIKDGVTILGVQGTFEGGTLQSKTADSSTESQLIEPDYGNYGLSSVTVNPYTLDSSSLVITENGDYAVESTADGLSRVDVSVNIDTSTYYNNGYAAGETAGIAEGIAQQKALLDSSTFTANATYTRADGWDEITVAVPIPTFTTQSKTVNSSTNSQEVKPDSGYDGLSKVTVNPYTLDSKTVDSSTNSQTVVSSANGLSSVIVNPYVLDSSTVDPSTNQITVTSAEDGLSSVIVNAVTSSIDANIAAGNIKDGVTILGVQGTYTGATINNQNKTVDSSTNQQSVTYESGYTGLGTVTVNPYTLGTKTVDASTNTIIVTSGGGESYILANTGYFLTGYIPNINSVIEFDVDQVSGQSQNLSIATDDEDGDYSVGIYNGSINFGNATFPSGSQALGTGRHTIKISKNWIIRDGTTYNATQVATAVDDYNLPIYAVNEEDSIKFTAQTAHKVYSIKIWENDVLLHEFVPAYYNSHYTFYDTVNNNYLSYSNAPNTLGYIAESYDGLSQVTVTGLNLDTIYNTLAAY